MDDGKRFRIQDDRAQDVMGGELALGNAYVSAYGSLVRGRPPAALEVGETCVKEYSLSGQRPTRYTIVRTK